MKLMNAVLVRIKGRDADAFMEQYEHLGDVGLGVWHWGLLIDGVLASVVSFGVPCFSPRRGFLADASRKCRARLLQLCRGATASWAPRNTPSRTIALALRRISTDFGPSLVVAYADERFSEVGTIYQASNAIYTGLTNPKGQANYLMNGKLVSGWVVRKRYGTRSRQELKTIDPHVAVLALCPKFRYILLAGSPAFRRHASKILEPCRKSYPKRQDLGIAPMNINQPVNVLMPYAELSVWPSAGKQPPMNSPLAQPRGGDNRTPLERACSAEFHVSETLRLS